MMDYSTISYSSQAIAMLDRATSIMIGYFGDLDFTAAPIPTWWDEAVFNQFVLGQFRALREIGIPVNPVRLLSYFPAGTNLDVINEPYALNFLDNKQRVFIDMEGSANKPVEVVLLFSKGNEIVHIKQLLGRNRFPTPEERDAVKYEHGLALTARRSLSKKAISKEIHDVLTVSHPEEIVVKRKEVLEMLDCLEDKVTVIQLPRWRFRPCHYSYQLARLLKSGKYTPNCDITGLRHTHSGYIGPEKRPVTVGSLNRAAYGFSCAYAGAFETFHYYLSRDETKQHWIDVSQWQNFDFHASF